MLADSDRRRVLEAAAPLPPPAPAKIRKDQFADVVLLCQRHTQVEVATLFGVNQMTIWRTVRRAAGGEGAVPAGTTGA